MAKLTLKKGLTDVTVYLFIQDSSKTTGEGLTGLAYNTANLVASYVRPLGSRTAITLATLAAVTSAHTDGGFIEIDATNMPGVYRLDLPDAVCATGVNSAIVMLKGAANMAPVLLELQLTSYDPNDAVRLGMTALPNAAADAAGGLPISDAGGLDIDAQLGTKVSAIESRLTSARAGYLDKLNVSGTLAHSDTAATYKADVSGIPAAVWGHATRTLSSFGTLVSDIWSAATRTLSAFAFTVSGAKDAVVDAIKAKTDNLPDSPAAVGSAMTLTSGERTAIANEVEAQIIDDTDAEKVLKAITDKIASVNPSLDDLTLAGIASAVRTELTTELARIDAAISSRLATAGYTAPANADISTIKSKTDNLPASPAASGEYTAALATVGSNVTSIKTKTDNLPASPAAVGSAMTLSNNAITAAVIATDAIDADAIKADAITEIQAGLALEATLTAIKGAGWTTETLAALHVLIDAIKAKTDNLPTSPAATGAAMTLADGAITASKFDESTAFPVKLADTGATQIARVGADSDTLETLSDQLDAIDDYIDTEVAAIKAKTDLIPTGTTLTIASAVVGSTITAIRGDTLSAALENIGALTNYSKLWFTVKRDYDDADSAAVVQIEKTGGLLFINGAAGTTGNGSLTINDEATGDVTIVLNASETAKLSPGNYQYDIQILRSAGTPVSTLTYGEFVVAADVTRATS